MKMRRSKFQREMSGRLHPMEKAAVLRALQKPYREEARNRDFDIRCSFQEGEYERAMVAAALRVVSGK